MKNKRRETQHKIVKYIHAIQPGTICNLNCSYCYVQKLKDKGQPATFDYPVEHMIKALSKERVGGTAFITYVGGGETLIPPESIQLIRGLLENGHLVNVTSNIVYSPGIDALLEFPRDLLDRLSFTCSLHYVSLIERNKKEEFINSLNKFKQHDISYHVNMTIGEDYLPYLDEIKQWCLDEIGFLPTVTFAVDADNGWRRYPLFTYELVKEITDKFLNSSVATFEEYFGREYRKEFCYIGDWGFILNLQTGNISACFQSPTTQNIFENLSEPIKYEAVGTCCATYCTMGPAFQAFGFLPDFDYVFPTYYGMYKDKMYVGGDFKEYLNNKLSETNKKYSFLKKMYIKYKRYSSKEYRERIKQAKSDKGVK